MHQLPANCSLPCFHRELYGDRMDCPYLACSLELACEQFEFLERGGRQVDGNTVDAVRSGGGNFLCLQTSQYPLLRSWRNPGFKLHIENVVHRGALHRRGRRFVAGRFGYRPLLRRQQEVEEDEYGSNRRRRREDC